MKLFIMQQVLLGSFKTFHYRLANKGYEAHTKQEDMLDQRKLLREAFRVFANFVKLPFSIPIYT